MNSNEIKFVEWTSKKNGKQFGSSKHYLKIDLSKEQWQEN